MRTATCNADGSSIQRSVYSRWQQHSAGAATGISQKEILSMQCNVCAVALKKNGTIHAQSQIWLTMLNQGGLQQDARRIKTAFRLEKVTGYTLYVV